MRSPVRLFMIAASLTLMAGTVGAFAWDSGPPRRSGDDAPTLDKLVSVHGSGLGAFDISFVDPKIGLYVLSDRTNGSVDMLDSEHGDFIGRIGAVCPAKNPAPHFCFQGVVLNPPAPPVTVEACRGCEQQPVRVPDGVTTSSGNNSEEIWAGDGDSMIKVIDLKTRSFITTISTGGTARVDEMAYDPRDHILAAANNADTPPFLTLFDTQKKTIIGKMEFSTAGVGVDAEGGLEQSKWSPETGLFYVSVPQVGADPTIGGVSVIDPHTMTVIRNVARQQLLASRHRAWAA